MPLHVAASARTNSTFVTEAVNDLVKLNLVEEIFCAPDIINLLSVSTRNSSKQRLILDLRHVNAEKFPYNSIHSLCMQIYYSATTRTGPPRRKLTNQNIN